MNNHLEIREKLLQLRQESLNRGLHISWLSKEEMESVVVAEIATPIDINLPLEDGTYESSVSFESHIFTYIGERINILS